MARTKGSKNQPAPVVIVETSACPKCGSHKRSNYANTRTFEYAGNREGKQYTKVIWRNCWCLECNQHRIDKSFI